MSNRLLDHEVACLWHDRVAAALWADRGREQGTGNGEKGIKIDAKGFKNDCFLLFQDI